MSAAQDRLRYRSTAPRRLTSGALAGLGQMEILDGVAVALLRAFL